MHMQGIRFYPRTITIHSEVMSNNSNACPKLSLEVISFSYWSGGLGLGATNVERAPPLQQFTIAPQALASLPLAKVAVMRA